LQLDKEKINEAIATANRNTKQRCWLELNTQHLNSVGWSLKIVQENNGHVYKIENVNCMTTFTTNCYQTATERANVYIKR